MKYLVRFAFWFTVLNVAWQVTPLNTGLNATSSTSLKNVTASNGLTPFFPFTEGNLAIIGSRDADRALGSPMYTASALIRGAVDKIVRHNRPTLQVTRGDQVIWTQEDQTVIFTWLMEAEGDLWTYGQVVDALEALAASLPYRGFDAHPLEIDIATHSDGKRKIHVSVVLDENAEQTDINANRAVKFSGCVNLDRTLPRVGVLGALSAAVTFVRRSSPGGVKIPEDFEKTFTRQGVTLDIDLSNITPLRPNYGEVLQLLYEVQRFYRQWDACPQIMGNLHFGGQITGTFSVVPEGSLDDPPASSSNNATNQTNSSSSSSSSSSSYNFDTLGGGPIRSKANETASSVVAVS